MAKQINVNSDILYNKKECDNLELIKHMLNYQMESGEKYSAFKFWI